MTKSKNLKFYRDIEIQAQPNIFISFHKKDIASVKFYENKMHLNGFIKYIKTHFTDTSINPKDPVAPNYVMPILLLGLPLNLATYLDINLYEIIHNVNQEYRNKTLKSDFAADIAKNYVLYHARRILLSSLIKIAYAKTHDKDSTPFVNSTKKLMNNSVYLQWIYKVVFGGDLKDGVKPLNTLQFTKVCVKMLNALNPASMKDNVSGMPVTIQQRKIYAKYLTDNTLNAAAWI